jgi:hypothetical protein
MRTITCNNVNEALVDGLWLLRSEGVLTESRNGPVLRAPGPVTTIYKRPNERVLFSAARDANPFFHLYECAWMLAGRNDTESVARFAKNMTMFGNDDGVMTGAYGFRWREHFGFDQVKAVVALLCKDRSTRRAVLGMWDPDWDLQTAEKSKDVPCNTHVYFDASLGVLDMTVCNRSNDIVWGAYGANAVHMSFLHELVARSSDILLGTYYQMSNNYHLYLNRDDTARLIQIPDDSHTADRRYWSVVADNDNRYMTGAVPFPVYFGGPVERWLEDAELCAEEPYAVHPDEDALMDPFWTRVFKPMMRAHAAYKAGNYAEAFQNMTYVDASDWRIAGDEWLMRRRERRDAKEAA